MHNIIQTNNNNNNNNNNKNNKIRSKQQYTHKHCKRKTMASPTSFVFSCATIHFVTHFCFLFYFHMLHRIFFSSLLYFSFPYSHAVRLHMLNLMKNLQGPKQKYKIIDRDQRIKLKKKTLTTTNALVIRKKKL